jgi:hypothetical protein
MSRQQRSVEELQRASLAVQYELATLGGTHEMLHELGAHWRSSPRDHAISNALLHTFLLGARNLLAFLYSHNPRSADIVAEDFFDDPSEWTQHRAVPEPEMANGQLIGLISKRPAHLTWDRAGTDRPLWGAFRITWSIGLALQSFLQFVDQARVHRHLREDLGIMMSRLQIVANYWGGVSAAMAPAKELIEFDELAYFRQVTDPPPAGDDR